MASKTALKKIGLIVGSQRKPRAGRQVSDFVFDVIQKSHPGLSSKALLCMVDLQEWMLPMFDEPKLPAHITSADQYTHEHTKRWSAEISKYAAFVFVTPEYNACMPASLKNAIDFLGHEWKGKPAMIVSYGSRGGVNAANALFPTLRILKMDAVEPAVNMAYPRGEFMTKAIAGEALNLDSANDEGVWHEHRKEIKDVFDSLMEKIEFKDTTPAL